jgi:hypothetical protein
MKTKAKDEFVPKALREVWEWKDAVYQETKHLSTREALDYILKQGGVLPIATKRVFLGGFWPPKNAKLAKPVGCVVGL